MISMGTIRGIVTGLLIVTFVGICIWAYSRKRKARFDAEARLPLDDSYDRDPAGKR